MVEEAILDAVTATEMILQGELDQAMNDFNGKKQEV